MHTGTTQWPLPGIASPPPRRSRRISGRPLHDLADGRRDTEGPWLTLMDCPPEVSCCSTMMSSGALAIKARKVCRRCHSASSRRTPETARAASVMAAACQDSTSAVAVSPAHAYVCEARISIMTRRRTRTRRRLTPRPGDAAPYFPG